MKLHLPLSLRKCLLAIMPAVLSVTCGTANAGVMHTDVTLNIYTDFGQNKGRYVVGDRVNALVSYIRETEQGIGIPYTDGMPTYYIPLEQGMISFRGTGDNGAYAAISPNSMVTVAHNGSIDASYGAREVGEEHALNYEAIDIRYTSFRHTAPDDYMLQRQSKIQVDTEWNPLAYITDMEDKKALLNDYVYHSGAGTMGVWSNGVEQGLCGAYQYIIGGIFSTFDQTLPEEDKFVNRQNMEYSATCVGASEKNPLPNGIRGGDSGSPAYRYNKELGRYEFLGTYAVNSGTSTNWALSFPQWTLDELDSMNKRFSFGAVNTVYLHAASEKDGDYEFVNNSFSISSSAYKGYATNADGDILFEYRGLRKGLNTWADLSDLRDVQNWYAYDASSEGGKLQVSIETLYHTDNLVFEGTGDNTCNIVLNENVDMGIGSVEFNGGEFIIYSAESGNYIFDHAGYIVNEGSDVHVRFVNSPDRMTEWRKMGAGDLYIDGRGDTNALVNVGGSGTTYLQQIGGYAAYNVLANVGSTVVIADINQIKRDFTFGSGGGILDMNGNSMEWYLTAETENAPRDGFSINALTEEAVIANKSGDSVLTYKQEGNTTYLGSFKDTKDASLRIDYQGGGVWTLNGIHTNLLNNSSSGLTVSNGQVVLKGINTIHGMGSEIGRNANRLVVNNDWHYADAKMNVTVKAGATFELDTHARLTGDVTVENGATYIMREGVYDRYEYVEGGALLEDTYIYRDFYGHKGNVNLEGNMLVQYSEGSTVRNIYSGDISGSGALTIDLGTDGAILELSGDNSAHTGHKELVSGGVIATNANAMGNTVTHQWLVGSQAWIVSQAESGADLLEKISVNSTGTLALSSDTEHQLDLTGHTGLYVGAEEGKTVQYGTADAMLDAVLGKWKLGGGGGELVVNFLLTGNNSLVLGAHEAAVGTVTLTNAANDFTGALVFNSAGIILNAVDGALGYSNVNLTYGNALAVPNTAVIANVTTASDGMLLLDTVASEAIDITSYPSLSVGAGTSITFSENLVLADDSDYRFGAVNGAVFNIATELDSARDIEVDAQGLTGGTVMLSGNEVIAGNVTVQGHRSHEASGEMVLAAGRDMTLNGEIRLEKNGVLDVAGKQVTLTSSLYDYGGYVTDSVGTGALIFDCGNGSIETDASLRANTIRKVGENSLILKGNGNSEFRNLYVEGGALTLGSATAIASDAVVFLHAGTIVDVSTYGCGFTVAMADDAGTATLKHSGTNSVTITGNILLGRNSCLKLDDGNKYVLKGAVYGGEGASLAVSSTVLELNRPDNQSFSGNLVLAGDVRIESRGSAEDMERNFEKITLNGKTALWEESWSTIWNIAELSGHGELNWLSNTTHDTTSRLILAGDGDFVGSIKLDRDYEHDNRHYGAFIELKSDTAVKNASIDLDGHSAKAVASLAINTANAHLKGLNGTEHSLVYAGSSLTAGAKNNVALSPSTSRASTFTIDTESGTTYTYAGQFGLSTDTLSSGLSLVKNGDGTQKFTGAVTVRDLTVNAGVLSMSGNTTVLGNIALAQGSELSLTNYSLSTDKTFTVSGGDAAGSAVYDGTLSLNGGALVFDAAALLDNGDVTLQIGNLTIGSGVTEQRIVFNGASALSVGVTYTLASGNWSSLIDNIAYEGLSNYYNVNFGASSEGHLQMTLATLDGSSVWDGNDTNHEWGALKFGNAAVLPTTLARFDDAATNKNVVVSAQVSSDTALFQTTGEYSVNAADGGLATVRELHLSGGGTLMLNSGIEITDKTDIADGVLVLKSAGLSLGNITGNGTLEIDWGADNSGSLHINNLKNIKVTSGTLGLWAAEMSGTESVELDSNSQLTITSNWNNLISTDLIGEPAIINKHGNGTLTWAPRSGNFSINTLNINAGAVEFQNTKGVSSIANITGSGTLNLTGTGTTEITGNATLNTLYAQRGILNILNGAVVIATRLEASDSNNVGDLTLNVEEGATLRITGGDVKENYKNTGFLLSEWNAVTTLNVDGTILAPNASTLVGDSGANINISGIMAVKGIGNGNDAKNGGVITLNLQDGGKLILGQNGISTGKFFDSDLGAGVIGISYVDSSSASSGIVIAEDLRLNSTTGTIFDTCVYSLTDTGITQETTAGRLILTGALTGDGLLVKKGVGDLELQGSRDIAAGTIRVDEGRLVITHTGEDATVVNIAGISGNGNLRMKNDTTATLNLSGSTVGSLSLMGGTTNITGIVTLGDGERLSVGKATLNINEGAVVTTSKFRGGDEGNGHPSEININGGTLNVTGSSDTHSTDAAFLLAHWQSSPTVLNLHSGLIHAENAVMYTSWGTGGTFKALGGEARVKGISLKGQTSERYGTFELGTAESGDAEVYIGSLGISDVNHNSILRLGNGTLIATSNFSVSGSNTAQLLGRIGTVIDTAGYTVTFSTPLSSETGEGKMLLKGGGKLSLAGTAYLGELHVEDTTQVSVANTGSAEVNLLSYASSGILDVNGSATVANLSMITPGELRVTGAGHAELKSLVGVSSLSKTGAGELAIGMGVFDTITLKGAGTTHISAEVEVKNIFSVGKGSVNLTDGADVEANRFVMGNDGNVQPSVVTIGTGAKLTITGTTDADATNNSLLLAHWHDSDSSLILAGGELSAKNTTMLMGWDSAGTFEANAGTASLKGVRFTTSTDSWGSRSHADRLLLGSANTGSAILNIGSGGIIGIGTNDTVQFGNGTLAATADFSISGDNSISFIGAVGGTIVDTAGYNITVNTAVSGNGKILKQGLGALQFNGNGSGFNGDIVVETGTFTLGSVDAAAILGTANSFTLNTGTVLDLSALSFIGESATPINLASGNSVSLANGMVELGNLTQTGSYQIFSGALIADGEELSIGNFSVNGVSLSRYENAQLSVSDSAIVITLGSLDYVTSSLIWNGGSSGVWDTTTSVWDPSPSEPDDNTVFCNKDSVVFASDADLQVVGTVRVNNLTVEEGVSLTTIGNLLVEGAVSLGTNSTFSFSGNTSVSFTEAQLKQVSTNNSSIIVGEGATLTLTSKDTNQNSSSNAFDRVSGAGDVVLNLAADNGIGFDFSGISGDIYIATGRLQVNQSSFNEASTIHLTTDSGHLVFHGSGTELTNAVVLDADTSIYVNNDKSATISGVISGVGALTKLGAGELTLTQQTTYAGDTHINAGRIILDTGSEFVLNGALLNGSLEIASGTTLNANAKVITTALTLAENAGFILDTGVHGASENTLKGDITVNAGARMAFIGTWHDSFNAGAGKSLIVNGGEVDFGTTRQTFNNWRIELSNGAKLTGDGADYAGTAYRAALDFSNDTTIFVTAGDNSIAANMRLRGGNSRTLTLDVASGASLDVSGRIHADSTAALGQLAKSGGGELTLSSQVMLNQLTISGGNATLAHIATDGNTLNQFSVETDSSLRLKKSVKLNVKDSFSLSANAAVELEKGAKLQYQGVEFSNRGSVIARLSSSSNEAGAYTAESTEYELSLGHLVSKSSDDFVLGNKMTGASLEVIGSGKVTLNREDNAVSAMYALNGDIELLNGAECNLEELVIYTDRDVASYHSAVASEAEIGTMTLSGRGEIADGATLTANLELLEGASLSITDTRTAENHTSTAVHSLSGTGKLILHLASSQNGIGFNLGGFMGNITLATGCLQVNTSQLHADATIHLLSSDSILVFNDTDTEISNDVILDADAEIVVNAGMSGTLNGVISGEKNVTIKGEGSLTFGSDNAYTGTTTITDGKLILSTGADYELLNSVIGGTLELANGTTLINNGHVIDSALVLQDGTAVHLSGTNTFDCDSVTVTKGSTATLSTEENLFISDGMLLLEEDATLNLEGKAYTFASGNVLSSAATLNVSAETIGIKDAATTTLYGNVNIVADSTLNLPRGSGNWATAGLNLSSTMTIAEGKTLTVTGNARMQINDGGVLVLTNGATVDRTGDGAYYIKGSLATAEDATAVFKSVNDIHLNYINSDYNLSDTGGSIDVAKDSTLKLSVKNLHSYGKAVINVGENAMLDASGTNTISLSGDTSVNMEQGGSFKVKDKVTFSNRGAADTATLKGNGAYGMGASAYELKDGHLSFYADSQATIKNKLTNSSVQNDSEYVLRLDNAGNTLSGVFAESGDIILQNQSTHTLQELKLATELTLSAYKGTSETSENEARITVQKCAEFGVSTTLNADLLMAAGSELKMHGTVSMGSDLTIEAGVMLTGDLYEALGGLINDGISKVVLFEGIDTLHLGTEAQTTSSITLEAQLLASTYFSNLENTDYLLVYDASDSGNGILSIMVPEPASSTLSLLALAAMAARRRRRK